MTRIEQRFDRVDRSFDRVWDEFRELRADLGAVRGEISASTRQLAQIGWALVGILLVQLIAAVVAFH